jgi:hypothetical protein
MQDDKAPDISNPDTEQKSPENGGAAPVEQEREKDNRAEALRAIKKLGRGRKR